MFRNVLNGFRKLVNPAWTFIRFSHHSPVWHQNKESIIYNSVCEIPEGTLERINMKNVSRRDCKHKTNDQMGKHVNQNLNVFSPSFKGNRSFFLQPWTTRGRETGRCPCHRGPRSLATAERAIYESLCVRFFNVSRMEELRCSKSYREARRTLNSFVHWDL